MTLADLAACLGALKRRVDAHDGALAEHDSALAAHEGALIQVTAELAALASEVRPRPDKSADPVRWRRALLRELKVGFYRFMSRTAAAKAIALDWAAYAEARRNNPPSEGTREALFDELLVQGCRPLSERQIREDLIAD